MIRKRIVVDLPDVDILRSKHAVRMCVNSSLHNMFESIRDSIDEDVKLAKPIEGTIRMTVEIKIDGIES